MKVSIQNGVNIHAFPQALMGKEQVYLSKAETDKPTDHKIAGGNVVCTARV